MTIKYPRLSRDHDRRYVLTSLQVQEVKALSEGRATPEREIAKMYSVSPAVIGRILHPEKYKQMDAKGEQARRESASRNKESGRRASLESRRYRLKVHGEAFREWERDNTHSRRLINPVRSAAACKRYYESHRTERNKYSKEYYSRHAQEVSRKQKEWRDTHTVEQKAKKRAEYLLLRNDPVKWTAHLKRTAEYKRNTRAKKKQISMARCENCGCGLNGGICSNCHEELYILSYQGEYMDGPPSKEFMEKADMQQEEIKQRDAT